MKTIDEKTKRQESNTNKDLINLLTLYYLQYTLFKFTMIQELHLII